MCSPHNGFCIFSIILYYFLFVIRNATTRVSTVFIYYEVYKQWYYWFDCSCIHYHQKAQKHYVGRYQHFYSFYPTCYFLSNIRPRSILKWEVISDMFATFFYFNSVMSFSSAWPCLCVSFQCIFFLLRFDWYLPRYKIFVWTRFFFFVCVVCCYKMNRCRVFHCRNCPSKKYKQKNGKISQNYILCLSVRACSIRITLCRKEYDKKDKKMYAR